MSHVTALRLLLVLALAMVGSAVADAHDGSAHSSGLSEAAQLSTVSSGGGTGTLTGWLHVLYGDAPPGWSPGGTSGYVLLDDQGQATELLVPEDVLRAAGGRRAVNGRHMTVVGQSLVPSPGAGQGGPMPLLGVQALQPTEPQALGALGAQSAVTGPQPWVTVLCRFADEAGVTPRSKAWFESLLLGSVTAPGLDHYWRQVSYGNVNLTGSVVVGWYTLPQPRSYYVYGSPLQLDFQRAASDCTGVADADVYFPGFVGINLAFNDNLDCCAWGGSWTLTRDGQSRAYRMTWLPPWGYENQGPVAHEMGHGFGRPHSSGPYSATYDSAWDVMSGIWLDCPPYDPSYGCVGTHTISYHKDILGWIPAAQRYMATAGTSQTITLERLGLPTTSNYLMAKIPIGGSATNFYTVEVRRFVGYDATLPGEAVVIHKVDTTRSDRDAQVVDPDGNGDPNDAGAMWLPGETFFDSPNGISVSVVGQTATGFQVTVANGVSTALSTLTVSPVPTNGSISGPGISCGAGTTGDCAESVASGTSVVLTASSATGYQLGVWSGCQSVSGTQCTVQMTRARTVAVTFRPLVYALTISPVATHGTITGPGISCGAGATGGCTESVASGTSLLLSAHPVSGYRLGAWSGCQSVNGSQCTVQMTQARTVSATFTSMTAPAYGATYQSAPFTVTAGSAITVP